MYVLSIVFGLIIIFVLFLVPFLIIIGIIFLVILLNINYNFFYYNRNLRFSDFSYFKNTVRFLVKFISMTLGSKYELKITTKDKIKYCGDSFNSTLCKCLYINNNYEPSITEYLKNTLKKGDIFIDVGANEGVFSILAGKLVGESGKVYCIEPLPRNISILKKNIRINNLKNIVVHSVAAGEKNKIVMFYDIKFNNMMAGANNEISNLLSKIPRLINFIKTKQKRLDTLIHEPLEKIKAIKIDTEGYEEYVLKGMDTWLNEKCFMDFIIEMTPSKSGNVIDLFLDKLKYKGYMHWMDSVAYNDKVNWEKLDRNCNFQKNVLFTKKDKIKSFC